MKTKYLDIAEKAFVVIGLTFFSGGFSVGAVPGVNAAPGLIPPIVISIIRYFVWVTSTILIGFRWKQSLAVASKEIFLWILTILILQSYIWSDYPDVTYLDGREVWQMTSFALYFASRFNLKEQVQLIAITFGIAGILSAITGGFFPATGQHAEDHPGAWKGIYDYKNTLGSMMIIGSLAFFLLPLNNLVTPIRRNIGYLLKCSGIALFLAIVLLCTSKTSLVIYFLLVGILIFYGKFRWQGKITVIYLDISILILVCVGTLLFSNWVNLLTGLGKDHTLTGRTPMWGVMIQRIMDRPWLGYGRGAFWIRSTGYPQQVGSAASAVFVAPHGHNGFFDLMLDVGLIGFTLFMICYLVAFARSLKRAYNAKSSEDLWPLAFLLFLAMNNIMESYLLRLANIYWVLFLTAVLSVPLHKRKIVMKSQRNYLKTAIQKSR